MLLPDVEAVLVTFSKHVLNVSLVISPFVMPEVALS